MKKKVALAILVIICLSCALLSACSCGDEVQEVVLGFDSTSAYFTGTKALVPISGTAPASGDIYEEATVKITAGESVKMKLTAAFSDNDKIDKLMVSVNNAVAVEFTPGIKLYESSAPETEKEINLKLFLAADADAALSAGKQLVFSFELTYWQE